jgi:diadenylate cyclase
MLGEILKTGTIVDAAVSMELIGNIFFPKAPLHDGAMVVREGKVAAAGCILPLTKNPDVPPKLGTRHRAALGLSEECDALIAVVSEETGNISLANRGTLQRELTQGQLQAILLENLLHGNRLSAPALAFRRRFNPKPVTNTQNKKQ